MVLQHCRRSAGIGRASIQTLTTSMSTPARSQHMKFPARSPHILGTKYRSIHFQPASSASHVHFTSAQRVSFHATACRRRESSALEKPEGLDAAETTIWDRLVKEYDPTELDVRDISGGCGSMYYIEVTSQSFQGKRELQQQRMVLATLKDLRENWHGIQLKTHVPGS